MEVINYTEMVNNWPTMMVKVTNDHVPLIITSEYCQPVVMMSLEDFNAWQETEYLTRSSANAKDLMFGHAVTSRPAKFSQARIVGARLVICFRKRAWEDYLYWQQVDKSMLKRINALIKDIQRTPFSGLGKPEPLKHQFTGLWSRRVLAFQNAN